VVTVYPSSYYHLYFSLDEMKLNKSKQKSHVNIEIFLINVENIPSADLDFESVF